MGWWVPGRWMGRMALWHWRDSVVAKRRIAIPCKNGCWKWPPLMAIPQLEALAGYLRFAVGSWMQFRIFLNWWFGEKQFQWFKISEWICSLAYDYLPLLIVPHFVSHVFCWKRSSWCRRKHVNNTDRWPYLGKSNTWMCLTMCLPLKQTMGSMLIM